MVVVQSDVGWLGGRQIGGRGSCSVDVLTAESARLKQRNGCRLVCLRMDH